MVPSRTLRTEIFGVKFLFDTTLQRPRPTLKFLCARPSILTAIDLCQNRRLRARLRLPVKTWNPLLARICDSGLPDNGERQRSRRADRAPGRCRTGEELS
jgi:hypothetical protein